MNIDIAKCRKALQLLIDGNHSLHVPPEKDDADVLIADALNELERLQEEEDLQTEPVSEVVQFWVDACAAKDMEISKLDSEQKGHLHSLFLKRQEIESLKSICFTALQEIFNSEFSIKTKEDLVNIARIALLQIK